MASVLSSRNMLPTMSRCPSAAVWCPPTPPNTCREVAQGQKPIKFTSAVLPARKLALHHVAKGMEMQGQ